MKTKKILKVSYDGTNKLYMFKTNKTNLKIGDIVIVPSIDSKYPDIGIIFEIEEYNNKESIKGIKKIYSKYSKFNYSFQKFRYVLNHGIKRNSSIENKNINKKILLFDSIID